jgi:predicted TIM-barrel fold metal-dependent hydrolase
MNIIDAHVHLDDRKSEDLHSSFALLNSEMDEAKIAQCVLLHLECQPWRLEDYAQIIPKYPKILNFANVHPYVENAKKTLERAVTEFGFCGLKLHPRLNGFKVDDPRVIDLTNFAGQLRIPVLIDAFPDGTILMAGFDPIEYARLAQAAPKTQFIWAHSGGHHCLDFMMLCRRLDNVSMDISYSYLYFRGSSVVQNLNYMMRSMRFKKIFYGSDFPDRGLKESLDLSLIEMDTFGFSEGEKAAILGGNFEEFLRRLK